MYESCLCSGASRQPSSTSANCRDDVETITANPKTAGVARWNFLALWGHHMRKGDSAALDYVTKVSTSSSDS
jgi:ABC-type sulfate transport system substrate-binding protein